MYIYNRRLGADLVSAPYQAGHRSEGLGHGLSVLVTKSFTALLASVDAFLL